MIILYGVALLLSTAVANKTCAALSCQVRGTTHETHMRGPGSPDVLARGGQAPGSRETEALAEAVPTGTGSIPSTAGTRARDLFVWI